MAELRFWWAYHLTGAQEGTREQGSLAAPVVMSGIDGLAYEANFSISNNGTATLFTAGSDLSDFDALIVLSNKGTVSAPVYLELVIDNGAEVGRVAATMGLLANFPAVFFNKSAYANYTVNFGGGTADTMEVFRVQNKSGETAKVSVWAFT
jgi:hypothetical protein